MAFIRVIYIGFFSGNLLRGELDHICGAGTQNPLLPTHCTKKPKFTRRVSYFAIPSSALNSPPRHTRSVIHGQKLCAASCRALSACQHVCLSPCLYLSV